MTLTKLNTPRKGSAPLTVGVLVLPETFIGLALTLKDIFDICNLLLKKNRYNVDLISTEKRIQFGSATLTFSRPGKKYHAVFIPPLAILDRRVPDWKRAISFLEKQERKGVILASACLGSLLLAKGGFLNGMTATTHWNWVSYARQQFPSVQWNESVMICNEQNIITAGGFLALIDLCLYFISRTESPKIAHQVGKIILADTTRQRQSIYAATLVNAKEHIPQFMKLESWIGKNLGQKISVVEMARSCNMSLRNFQRLFALTYGVSPKRFLQLKRIEKAKELMESSNLNMDRIVEQIGFMDPASFRKLFQRELGVTPAGYRRKVTLTPN